MACARQAWLGYQTPPATVLVAKESDAAAWESEAAEAREPEHQEHGAEERESRALVAREPEHHIAAGCGAEVMEVQSRQEHDAAAWGSRSARAWAHRWAVAAAEGGTTSELHQYQGLPWL